jgi:hypothetical protein
VAATVAPPAPASPSAGSPPQPNMRNGSSAALKSSVAVATIMGVRVSPRPRKTAPASTWRFISSAPRSSAVR